MKALQFTKSREQVLRDQVIDDEGPGPVLRDFGTVLDFVGVPGVKAAGKYNLLPIEAIAELDARLSRSLRLEMKRPQLRSHPYLWGLQLLLRASALSRVEGTGAQTRLLLDPSMLAQWNHLNATEQYFTLLEAWLRIGRAEMVGEQGGRSFGDLLLPCLQTWQHLPAKGERYDIKKPQYVYVSFIGREFYQLALMDLFGLVEVEQPPRGVTPWCPAAVQHTPFGDALFALLADRLLCKKHDWFAEEDSSQPPRFGEWQPIFQPYFPEWCKNLHVPEIEQREGIFLFRVSLGKAWRRIALRDGDTVDDLVTWILKSVDFDSDHLYELRYRDPFGRTMRILHPYMAEQGDGPSGAEVSLGELPLLPSQSMTLVYDFGDNWHFDVKLEAIEPPEAKIKTPHILEKHGIAPEQYPSWEE
jgi:pRiA4b ORF-3-like protein